MLSVASKTWTANIVTHARGEQTEALGATASLCIGTRAVDMLLSNNTCRPRRETCFPTPTLLWSASTPSFASSTSLVFSKAIFLLSKSARMPAPSRPSCCAAFSPYRPALSGVCATTMAKAPALSVTSQIGQSKLPGSRCLSRRHLRGVRPSFCLVLRSKVAEGYRLATYAAKLFEFGNRHVVANKLATDLC